MRSRLDWSLAKSLGLDANAIRQLLEDKSIENALRLPRLAHFDRLSVEVLDAGRRGSRHPYL
jgi:hypothetical protein